MSRINAAADNQEDIRLVNAIINGDSYSFRKLVDKYKERAVRIAFSICGNLDDAKDIAQDVFIKVHRNIGNFEFKSSFMTWLYRVIVNQSRDFLRRKKRSGLMILERTKEFDFFENTEDLRNSGPAQELLNKELMRHIDIAAADLSEKQRIVFVLKYRQGLKLAEITEIMDSRLSTVKAHLFRAVNKVQKRLREYLGGEKL